MFRHFVSPTTLGRDNMRQHNAPGVPVLGQVVRKMDESNIAGSQLLTDGVVETNYSSSAEKDVNPTQLNFQKDGYVNSKTGYTTVITVKNVSSTSKNRSHVPINGSRNLEDLPENKNPGSAIYLRSTPLPNSSPNLASHGHHEIQRPLSDISVRDNYVNQNDATRHSAGPSITDHQMPHASSSSLIQNGSSTNIHNNGGQTLNTRNLPERQMSNESEDLVSELPSRKLSLYSQTTYNVVPSPPPEVQSAFVGRRSFRDPSSVHERQIVSDRGTVRGFKNRVRAGIATFWEQPEDEVRGFLFFVLES